MFRATNPSELDLEFYYNDLQVPSKAAFTLLQNFSFNDKCRIHLSVDQDEKIITDGLIVRGVYSTITLAVYGYPVDKVEVKEPTPETPVVQDAAKENTAIPAGATSPIDLTSSPLDIEDSPKKPGTGEVPELKSPKVEDPTKPEVAATLPSTPDKKALDLSETPRAIPTITTRGKFDPFSSMGNGCSKKKEQVYVEEPIDRERDPAESDLSSDDHFDMKPDNVIIKPQVQPVAAQPVVATVQPVAAPMVELEDAENISDEEVFPEEEGMLKNIMNWKC